MNQTTHNRIVSFIWNIADDVLRDVYVRGKYRDVILPMTVIRRLDTLLEDTSNEVVETKRKLDEAKINDQKGPLEQAAGQPFYNTSQFTLKQLLDRPKQLKANFEAYLNGFSPNVLEIIDKFDFHNQLRKLSENDILGELIKKFIDPAINLSPHPVLDGQGNVSIPGLDNHAMGTVFEELIRKFNEENNEEAGEHFTPREVVDLMAKLMIYPVANQIKDTSYHIYDCACGTGGMLTISDQVLHEMAENRNKKVKAHLFGQEVNAETYAIAKADLLLKGEGNSADNIKFASVLANDAYPASSFHFMLTNPPYGKSWKTDFNRLCGGVKEDMTDPRFVVEHADDTDFRLITRSSDGQLMFMVNMLSKMKKPSENEFGSRVASIHNGSALFTGDAGSGESNIRRWVIENDWLEAIIALPLNLFYNTGIATYIWVLTNQKPDHRKGKVQLINAVEWYGNLRKNLGEKNCELREGDVQQILDTFQNFQEAEQSKIFNNEDFGYWRIVVERPLRLSYDLNVSEEALQQMEADKELKGFADRAKKVLIGLKENLDAHTGKDANNLLKYLANLSKKTTSKLSNKEQKALRELITKQDEEAEPIIKKRQKDGTIEYQPDTDLRDTEQVPLTEKGGIYQFFEREVLPHVPDAWIDESKTEIGYDIAFTRYFYQYEPLRPTDEIARDIEKLEKETSELINEIL